MRKMFVFAIVIMALLCISAKASLVSHWELNGSLEDSVGDNDGTSGVTVDYVTDAGRQAVQFTPATYSDASQRIVVPFASELNTTSFTISVWCKAPSKGSYGGLVSTADKTPTSVDEAGYILYSQPFSGEDNDCWSFWAGNNNWQKVYEIGTAPVDDTWVMVTGTYDAATKVQSLYINGALVNSITLSADYVPAADSDFFIGAAGNYGTPTYAFKGLVDDVRYYDNGMTAAEVQSLYLETVPEPASLLLLGASSLVLLSRRKRNI